MLRLKNVLSSARTSSDNVQSEGDRGRIGEDRSESVMSLILTLVNLGKETPLRSGGSVSFLLLLGHQGY
jgi:hypothetical protein